MSEKAPFESDVALLEFVQQWTKALRDAPRDRATLEAFRDGTRERLPDVADVLDLLLQLVDATGRDDVRRIESNLQAKGDALHGAARLLWTTSDPSSVRGDIRGCGFGDASDLRHRFAFICPLTWAELTRTEDSAIRACQMCERTVHRCDTIQDFEHHAQRGDCVYASSKLMNAAGRTLTVGYLGRPDPLAIWADQLFPPDADAG